MHFKWILEYFLYVKVPNVFSEELKEKFEGRLEKDISGPIYEVLAKVLKGIVNRKITVPGNFKG